MERERPSKRRLAGKLPGAAGTGNGLENDGTTKGKWERRSCRRRKGEEDVEGREREEREERRVGY